MTPLYSERHAVQNPLICYAQEAGWTYLPPNEALRRGDSTQLQALIAERNEAERQQAERGIAG